MTDSNYQILKEIKECRQDVKALIEAAEVRISLKTEEVNHKFNKIERDYQQISERIESINRKGRKNNIIIFGLKRKSEIKKLLDINIKESDINNLYTLGKIEFVSYLVKSGIFKNVNKLKGTNIFIAHDMTIKERQEQKILRKHLFITKREKSNVCYIRKNQFHINNTVYDPEQLEQIQEHSLDPVDYSKPNSAPGTPISSEQELLIAPRKNVNREPIKRDRIQSSNSTPVNNKTNEVKTAGSRLVKESEKTDRMATLSVQSKAGL